MKKSNRKTKEKFAPGMCFFKMFWIFVLFSVLGSFYEEILYFIQTWYTTGTGVWAVRRGVIYGPLNVIYGFGAVLFIEILGRKERSWWNVFLWGFLLGGAFEGTIGLLQRIFLQSNSWDYSSHFLNIAGVTSIPIMIVWGFLAVILIKFMWPFFSHIIEEAPITFGKNITTMMIVLVGLDIFVSWTALLRQTLRRMDVPAFTIVGKFYDEHYTDEFLKEFFPNMVEKEGKE